MSLNFTRGLRAGLAFCVLAFTGAGGVLADGQNPLEATWFYDAGKPVADKGLPTITLDGGKISGTDSCNRLIGRYTLTGARGISFMAAGTRMMCPDMTYADAFLKGLSAASSYKVKNDKLILRDTSGKTVLVLNRINR
jgi:heat shock protein HslJ